MTVQHVTHHIIEPGLSGDGIDAAEAELIRRKTTVVTAVSADWYSDLNDAIAEAGAGGTVRLSKNTTYTQDTPLRLVNGVTIEGEDRFTTRIVATGEAAIASATPATEQVQDAVVRGLELWGNEAGGIGLDARGLTRCRFDDLRIEGFTVHGVWWGGDQDTDVGGWSNLALNLRVRAPASGGAAMYFGGRRGATGPATANNIVVIGGALYSRETPNSYAVEIVHGQANRFFGVDMGYGVASGAAIRLGHDLARQNLIEGCRTENVSRAVLIEGAKHNTFQANAFGLASGTTQHGAEIYAGSLRNVFRGNWWGAGGPAPKVWEDAGPGTYETLIDDLTPDYGTAYGNVVSDPRGAIHDVNTGSSLAVGVGIKGDAFPRFFAAGDGRLTWRHPDTGVEVGGLRVFDIANNILEWSPGTRVRLAASSLPVASENWRGVMIRTEGGTGVADTVRVCLKNADGTYAWKVVSVT